MRRCALVTLLPYGFFKLGGRGEFCLLLNPLSLKFDTMKKAKPSTYLSLSVSALTLSLMLAACGGGDNKDNGGGTSPTPTARPTSPPQPSVSVITAEKAMLSIQNAQMVPYTGTDSGIQTAHPRGFSLAVGSGLAYIGTAPEGGHLFWGITDRGPNADSPDYLNAEGASSKSKVFPAPAFVPKIAKILLKDGQASVLEVIALQTAAGLPMSGLPVPPGVVGNSKEIALNEGLALLGKGYDENGIDPEGIALEKDGKHAWISDEYGPFLARVELATGKLVKKLAPGSGLPEIIKNRQPNRGAEGVAVTPNGKVYLIVQSIMEMPDTPLASGGTAKTNKAPFVRLVEYDPATEQTRQFAYPIDTAVYDKAKDAKIGDLVAINDTQFALIEQGSYKADGKVHNLIYSIDISSASDISASKLGSGLDLEYASTLAELQAAGVQTISKGLIADIAKDHGWTAEKMEGLAMIDPYTLALINDNDFGVKASLHDAMGASFKPDDCSINAALQFSGKKCTGTAPYTYSVGAAPAEEQGIHLWLLRLPKAVSAYLPAAL